MPNAGEWYQLDFPLRGEAWDIAGAPDWANIDYIGVYFVNTGYAGANDFWLDDLHLSGKIIREAYNSTDIGTYDEHQKIIKMDSAVDDSMKATDDTGTAARLAYAELLTRQSIPIVGEIVTPGIVDVLPGQQIHPHANKQASGSYRIDKDFRIKRILHSFNVAGFTTTSQVTDDLTNTFAKGPSDLASLFSSVMFVDPEAQSLKAMGIDTLVPRLSKDYP